MLSSGGTSAADVHSENFRLSKCSPVKVIILWRNFCGILSAGAQGGAHSYLARSGKMGLQLPFVTEVQVYLQWSNIENETQKENVSDANPEEISERQG